MIKLTINQIYHLSTILTSLPIHKETEVEIDDQYNQIIAKVDSRGKIELIWNEEEDKWEI